MMFKPFFQLFNYLCFIFIFSSISKRKMKLKTKKMNVSRDLKYPQKGLKTMIIKLMMEGI